MREIILLLKFNFPGLLNKIRNFDHFLTFLYELLLSDILEIKFHILICDGLKGKLIVCPFINRRTSIGMINHFSFRDKHV